MKIPQVLASVVFGRQHNTAAVRQTCSRHRDDAKATHVPMLLVFSRNDQVTSPDEVLTYVKAVGELAKAVPVRCDGHE